MVAVSRRVLTDARFCAQCRTECVCGERGAEDYGTPEDNFETILSFGLHPSTVRGVDEDWVYIGRHRCRHDDGATQDCARIAGSSSRHADKLYRPCRLCGVRPGGCADNMTAREYGVV